MEDISDSLERKRAERNAVNMARSRKKKLEDELFAAHDAEKGLTDLTALLASELTSNALARELPKPPTGGGGRYMYPYA
jgi:hypothetical protein